ncbi:hypothetical protein HYFRA_00010416 [Hymenoscyphus fraxineus]|uniref:Uncharacterized protein n=1 Tax=Hymenoscyphus fraxineus TaxID=746836 RepID=A0A9N9KZX5_9HELO|nr:hypothetical protein HYFRA_00010416 [Hymenoscyphus fraxineus]
MAVDVGLATDAPGGTANLGAFRRPPSPLAWLGQGMFSPGLLAGALFFSGPARGIPEHGVQGSLKQRAPSLQHLDRLVDSTVPTCTPLHSLLIHDPSQMTRKLGCHGCALKLLPWLYAVALHPPGSERAVPIGWHRMGQGPFSTTTQHELRPKSCTTPAAPGTAIDVLLPLEAFRGSVNVLDSVVEIRLQRSFGSRDIQTEPETETVLPVAPAAERSTVRERAPRPSSLPSPPESSCSPRFFPPTPKALGGRRVDRDEKLSFLAPRSLFGGSRVDGWTRVAAALARPGRGSVTPLFPLQSAAHCPSRARDSYEVDSRGRWGGVTLIHPVRSRNRSGTRKDAASIGPKGLLNSAVRQQSHPGKGLAIRHGSVRCVESNITTSQQAQQTHQAHQVFFQPAWLTLAPQSGAGRWALTEGPAFNSFLGASTIRDTRWQQFEPWPLSVSRPRRLRNLHTPCVLRTSSSAHPLPPTNGVPATTDPDSAEARARGSICTVNQLPRAPGESQWWSPQDIIGNCHRRTRHEHPVKIQLPCHGPWHDSQSLLWQLCTDRAEPSSRHPKEIGSLVLPDVDIAGLLSQQRPTLATQIQTVFTSTGTGVPGSLVALASFRESGLPASEGTDLMGLSWMACKLFLSSWPCICICRERHAGPALRPASLHHNTPLRPKGATESNEERLLTLLMLMWGCDAMRWILICLDSPIPLINLHGDRHGKERRTKDSGYETNKNNTSARDATLMAMALGTGTSEPSRQTRLTQSTSSVRIIISFHQQMRWRNILDDQPDQITTPRGKSRRAVVEKMCHAGRLRPCPTTLAKSPHPLILSSPAPPPSNGFQHPDDPLGISSRLSALGFIVIPVRAADRTSLLSHVWTDRQSQAFVCPVFLKSQYLACRFSENLIWQGVVTQSQESRAYLNLWAPFGPLEAERLGFRNLREFLRAVPLDCNFIVLGSGYRLEFFNIGAGSDKNAEEVAVEQGHHVSY